MLETQVVGALKNVFRVELFAHLDRASQDAALKTLDRCVHHLDPEDRRVLTQGIQSVAHYYSRFGAQRFVPAGPPELDLYLSGEIYQANRAWNAKYLDDYARRYDQGIDLYPVATRHGRNADLLGWAWFLERPARDSETGFACFRIKPVRLFTNFTKQ